MYRVCPYYDAPQRLQHVNDCAALGCHLFDSPCGILARYATCNGRRRSEHAQSALRIEKALAKYWNDPRKCCAFAPPEVNAGVVPHPPLRERVPVFRHRLAPDRRARSQHVTLPGLRDRSNEFRLVDRHIPGAGKLRRRPGRSHWRIICDPPGSAILYDNG